MKDPTNISKEINQNRFIKAIKIKENNLQSCQYRKNYTMTNLCNNCCGKQYKKYRIINCYRTCNKYSTELKKIDDLIRMFVQLETLIYL